MTQASKTVETAVEFRHGDGMDHSYLADNSGIDEVALVDHLERLTRASGANFLHRGTTRPVSRRVHSDCYNSGSLKYFPGLPSLAIFPLIAPFAMGQASFDLLGPYSSGSPCASTCPRFRSHPGRT